MEKVIIEKIRKIEQCKKWKKNRFQKEIPQFLLNKQLRD